MKTSKLKFTATLLALILVGFVSYSMKAYAQPPGFGRGMRQGNCQYFGDGEFKPGFFNRIPDLTEEQEAKIEKLRAEHLEKMLPMRNELGEKEARLRTLSTGKNVDLNKVNKMIEEIGSLKTKMAKERETHRQEIREMLTDSQKLAFDTFPPRRPFSGSDRPYRRARR